MKGEYIAYCKSTPGVPIFLQYWWLDAVCERMYWNAVVSYDKSENIDGLMPYIEETKKLLKLSRMPSLTPFLGPWVKPNLNVRNIASYNQKVLEKLAIQIPQSFHFFQKFSPSITNWYPFYLHKYDQSTAYTFILNNLNNEEALWDGMKNTVRTVIRKAEKEVSIVEKKDVEKLYALQSSTFSRQSRSVPYSKGVLRNIVKTTEEHQQGKMFFAQDKTGSIHAGLLLVWDEQTAYNLVIGVEERFKNSGAVQLLIWNAIKYSSKVSNSFNFEGSMLPHIEPIFRHFGGARVPYFRISKDRNRFYKALRILLGK